MDEQSPESRRHLFATLAEFFAADPKGTAEAEQLTGSFNELGNVLREIARGRNQEEALAARLHPFVAQQMQSWTMLGILTFQAKLSTLLAEEVARLQQEVTELRGSPPSPS